MMGDRPGTKSFDNGEVAVIQPILNGKFRIGIGDPNAGAYRDVW